MAERKSRIAIGKLLIRQDAATFERLGNDPLYATFEFKAGTGVNERRNRNREYCVTYRQIDPNLSVFEQSSWVFDHVTKWREPGVRQSDVPLNGWPVNREDVESLLLNTYGYNLDDLFAHVLKRESVRI